MAFNQTRMCTSIRLLQHSSLIVYNTVQLHVHVNYQIYYLMQSDLNKQIKDAINTTTYTRNIVDWDTTFENVGRTGPAV